MRSFIFIFLFHSLAILLCNIHGELISSRPDNGLWTRGHHYGLLQPFVSPSVLCHEASIVLQPDVTVGNSCGRRSAAVARHCLCPQTSCWVSSLYSRSSWLYQLVFVHNEYRIWRKWRNNAFNQKPHHLMFHLFSRRRISTHHCVCTHSVGSDGRNRHFLL